MKALSGKEQAMAVVELGIQLETDVCGKCGGLYALTLDFMRQKRRDGTTWHCPYCQSSWCCGETESDRLKKEIAAKYAELTRSRQREDQTKAALRETERSLIAQRGQNTKLRKRVANGVCPCCKRQFGNLGQHMRDMHPEFEKEEPTNATP